MHTDDPFVGAGLAGAAAAQTLSKDYLMGQTDRDATFVHPRHWYADHGIDLRTGVAVTGIEPGWQEITLADGSHLGYSKLLLTPGRPRGGWGSPVPSRVGGCTCGGSVTVTGSKNYCAPFPAS